jgi:hypothetical protein
MFHKCSIGVLALVAFAGYLTAQDAPAKHDESPDRYYRLDFVVKDVQDGKLLDSRNYFAFISNSTRGGRPTTSVRAESKVTLRAGSDYREFDLGTGIDCGYRADTKDTLGLNVNVDVTSLVPGEDKSVTNPIPIVRKNRWQSDLSVTLRKPTTIFSSDDVSSKRKLQIELTATPISQ